MPEEITRTLRCDAPDCDETGDYYRIEVGGITYRVILGEKHAPVLHELARWGRPDKVTAARAALRRSDRRNTDPRRLKTLIDVDKPEHLRGVSS